MKAKGGRPKGRKNSGRQVIASVARVALKEAKSEIVTRGRMGQPPADIDWIRVEQLLSLGCTDDEVAAGLGVDRNTLVVSKVHAAQYFSIKNRVKARTSLSIRQTMLAFMQGFRKPMVDDKGAPVLDAEGKQRTVVEMPSERVRFEATRFLAKQKQYLGWSERTDVTSDGERLPASATGLVSVFLVDDSGRANRDEG